MKNSLLDEVKIAELAGTIHGFPMLKFLLNSVGKLELRISIVNNSNILGPMKANEFLP